MMNRKFQILAQKSSFFGFSRKNLKKKLHQPNRIASTKSDFVDVADNLRIILNTCHEAIRDIPGNLGAFFQEK